MTNTNQQDANDKTVSDTRAKRPAWASWTRRQRFLVAALVAVTANQAVKLILEPTGSLDVASAWQGFAAWSILLLPVLALRRKA